mgnify:FL=1
MSWLDFYKKQSQFMGNNIRNAHEKHSVDIINYSYNDSPSCISVEINGEKQRVRVVTDKKYSINSGYIVKKLLLKPYETVNNGDLVKIDDEFWLIYFFDNKKPMPKAYMRFCNNTLTFSNGNQYPCVLDTRISENQKIDEKKYIDLPSDTMLATIQYNDDTKYIKENDRFIINGLAWEVQGYDRITKVVNEKGVISFPLKKVPLSDEEKNNNLSDSSRDNIYIEINGNEEIEVNTKTVYQARVYNKDNQLITTKVYWSTDNGKIMQNGLYTAPSSTGIVNICATYIYNDTKNNNQYKISEFKTIDIYDNNHWGWGT